MKDRYRKRSTVKHGQIKECSQVHLEWSTAMIVNKRKHIQFTPEM
jgi:hypothetical protein